MKNKNNINIKNDHKVLKTSNLIEAVRGRVDAFFHLPEEDRPKSKHSCMGCYHVMVMVMVMVVGMSDTIVMERAVWCVVHLGANLCSMSRWWGTAWG